MGLLDRIVCVSPVSKDLRGELVLVHSEPEECRPLECKTLEAQHQLKLAVTAHDCDAKVSGLLDGTLASGDLAHKFADADGTHRGVHEGTFRWIGRGVSVVGTLRGVTNAGTHRPPAFDECQKCDSPGVMEGLLVGTIRKAPDRRLIGCTVQAIYKLKFDAATDGGHGAVEGTLEGAIVCDCPGTQKVCVDLSTVTPPNGPGPLVVGAVTFDVGGPYQVRTMGTFTGLDVQRHAVVKFPPSSSIEATLVTFAAPATLQALSGGTPVGTATMSGTQNVAETLTLSGASIDNAVITAPADETLLLRFCYTPL